MLSALICIISACAQETANNNIITLYIPKNLNIKDKVIMTNKSPYTILQAAVVQKGDGVDIPIGQAALLLPGQSATIASFSNNSLKKLKGETLAIKIKGVKKIIGSTSNTSVGGGSMADGPFGVDVNHVEISAEELNNIDPSLITYDFNATASEDRHDLYITISSGADFFDF